MNSPLRNAPSEATSMNSATHMSESGAFGGISGSARPSTFHHYSPPPPRWLENHRSLGAPVVRNDRANGAFSFCDWGGWRAEAPIATAAYVDPLLLWSDD